MENLNYKFQRRQRKFFVFTKKQSVGIISYFFFFFCTTDEIQFFFRVIRFTNVFFLTERRRFFFRPAGSIGTLVHSLSLLCSALQLPSGYPKRELVYVRTMFSLCDSLLQRYKIRVVVAYQGRLMRRCPLPSSLYSNSRDHGFH